MIDPILESVEAPVLLLDRAGRILQSSRHCREAFAGTETDGAAFWDAVAATAERAGMASHFAAGCDSGGRFEIPCVRIDGLGEAIPAVWACAPAVGGQIVATFRERAARPIGRLDETLRRLGTLLDSLPGAAFRARLDDGLTMEYVSRGIVDICGYTPEEFYSIPLRMDMLVVPEDQGHVRSIVEEAVRSRRMTTGEWRIRTRQGEIRWLSMKGSAVIDESGAAIAFEGLASDVTGRKHAEEMLRKTADEYLLLFEKNPNPMWVFDRETLRFLAVNEAAVEHYGYSRHEFLSMTVKEIRPPEAIPLLLEDLARVGTGIDAPKRGWKHRKKDGQIIDVEIVSASLTYAGRPARLVLAHDLTERNRTERARRESERRYRDVFENTPIGIYRTTPDGRVLVANPAIVHMLGYESLQQVAARNLDAEEFEPDYSRQDFKRRLERDGEIRGFEARWKRADGSVIHVRESARAIYGEDGEIAWYEGTVEDITERKRAEEALRASEARFRAIFEGAGSGILVVGLDRNILESNAAAQQMLGMREEELRGLRSGSLVHPDDTAVSTALARDLVSGEIEHTRTELRLKRGDGGIIWGRIAASLVRRASGEPQFVILMIEDITERKRAEERLQRTVDQLAHSNAELHDFAYVASHDLQEPLRMVTSFMQLLRVRYKDQLDEQALEFIGFAVDGAARMKVLIDDLLAYSRLETRARPFRMTRCQSAYEQALTNLAAALDDSGGEVTAGELPVLAADPGQLVQLLQNLIGNALKFHDGRTPRVRVSAERTGEGWTFSVADNGIGIEPQHRERIFEIFHRLNTKAEYPGSGIGLTVCKKIVERHGGRIWVESTPGEGSTFRFTIPELPCAGGDFHESLPPVNA